MKKLILSAIVIASATSAAHAKSGKAPVKTATFAVTKMHCEGCAQGIKQASKNWTGVKSANVSFKNKRAFVAYDPKKTDEKKIAANFSKAGFPSKAVK